MAEAPTNDASRSATASLTRGLAAGDEMAFRQFQTLYFDRLYRFLLVVTRGDDTQAREALQETMLRVARSAKCFHSDEVFWSWLKIIGRNAARDAGRKQRRYWSLLERFTQRSKAETLPASRDDTLALVLDESVRELDLDDRRLIEGKYLDGQTVRELSAQAGLTEKAIESKLLRLRRQLRESILKKLKAP